jgi:hypothetical protein
MLGIISLDVNHHLNRRIPAARTPDLDQAAHMTATLFLTFVVITTLGILGAGRRFLAPPDFRRLAVGLPLWLVLVTALGASGAFRSSPGRPPRILLIILPVVAFVALVLVRSAAGRRVAVAVPLWLLIGAQCFRVLVELFLHQLAAEGIVPVMLTWSGANVDVWIGLTAPFVAWFSAHGATGRRMAVLWNILGLAALANVVTRAVLTAPGPLNRLRTDTQNAMFETFPYMLIPAIFVALAVSLHVLALRKLSASGDVAAGR